jgi:MATE family multidrug resistance protein
MAVIAFMALLMALPLMLFPEPLLYGFFSQETGDVRLYDLAYMSCKWLWIAFVLDGITWMIAGILTAAGDTRFIMYTTAINAWIFGVGGYYLAFGVFNAPVEMVPVVMTAYPLVTMVIFLWRYYGKEWQKKPMLI